ncbi:MAG: hypothetical protein HYU63_05635, partial [Armatimonadetes bacterium]|nr:hypothetical protein [Armatimonadota bacterium]
MDNLFKINQVKAKWTVLIYMGGDNFLEGVETKKLDWLEQIGSTKDVNLIVQYDRNPKEALKTNLEEAKYKFYPKDCARYYLKKSSQEKNEYENPALRIVALLDDKISIEIIEGKRFHEVRKFYASK